MHMIYTDFSTQAGNGHERLNNQKSINCFTHKGKWFGNVQS